MLIFLFCAGASVADAQPAPGPRREGEARTVIEAQLASPPRSGEAAGLRSDEADAVHARSIQMIGKTLSQDRSRTVP